jgi:hypothetical protein
LLRYQLNSFSKSLHKMAKSVEFSVPRD